jgi:hypothetical protein
MQQVVARSQSAWIRERIKRSLLTKGGRVLRPVHHHHPFQAPMLSTRGARTHELLISETAYVHILLTFCTEQREITRSPKSLSPVDGPASLNGVRSVLLELCPLTRGNRGENFTTTSGIYGIVGTLAGSLFSMTFCFLGGCCSKRGLMENGG